MLLISPELDPNPGRFRNMGIMQLDSPQVFSTAVADASGRARHLMPLPTTPSLNGNNLFIQGLRTNPRSLSDNMVAVGLLP